MAHIKSDKTVKDRTRELRRYCIEDTCDPLLKRIAQAIEYGIRWSREPVVGWNTPQVEAAQLAEILRKEIR